MSNKKVSYTEAFEELCPFYLSIGMSYEQYWYGVPYLVEVYMKSHKLNIQRRNEELWWQGVYIKNALETVLAGMFAKKGSKLPKYPEKPYDMFPKSEREKAKEAEKERQKAITSFMNLQQAMKRKFDSDNGDSK